MENFTAYENICLSSMIKDGRDQQTAMQGAETLMSQIGLPKSEVGISTPWKPERRSTSTCFFRPGTEQ